MVFVRPQGEFVEAAVEADAIVAADDPAAVGAFPLFGFSLEKGLYAVIADEFEVFYKAHMVIGPVPFIELLETLARENRDIRSNIGLCR